MIVVSDTSPLNYLVLIDAVDVLHTIYKTVFIPEQVLEELRRSKAPTKVSAWTEKLPDWITVRNVTGSMHEAVVSLHAGEAAATTLALQLGIKTLLVDDLEARMVAQDLFHLNVVGTLGILLRADAAGLLDAEESFRRLKIETTFRVSTGLENDFYASLRTQRRTATHG